MLVSRQSQPLMVSAFLLSLLGSAAAARKPVIVVADVGVDDAAGLLYVLGSPSLELLGIASSFGCHRDPAQTATNARRLLAAANRSDVPVYVGAKYPLGTSKPLWTEQEWQARVEAGTVFHGATGLGEPPPAGDEACAAMETHISAAEFIASAVRERAPGTVTLISFSPLPDVALALLLEPRLPSLLHALVLMGGATGETGVVNAHGNAMALSEANFYHDPAAAQLVLRAFSAPDATAEVVVAPLDVTMAHAVPQEVVDRWAKLGAAAALFADAYAAWFGIPRASNTQIGAAGSPPPSPPLPLAPRPPSRDGRGAGGCRTRGRTAGTAGCAARRRCTTR